LKRFVLIAVLVVSNAAVLAVSYAALRRSHNQLVHEFVGVQQRLARETATVLAARLAAMDRDSALLTSLVTKTRGERQIERARQDREILAACQALASTVPHYRTIGVFGNGLSLGAGPPIVAVDPAEDRTTTPPLLEASAPLAAEVSATQRSAWRGPLFISPGRAFYLYAAPAGPDEALVFTMDVAVLLEDILRLSGPGTKFVVSDAGSTTWLDCESARTCMHVDARLQIWPILTPPEAPMTRVGARGHVIVPEAPAPASIDRFTPAAAAVQVMASGESTILSTKQSVTTPLGVWSLDLYASTAAIDARQRTTVWQILLTSAGVMVTMLLVGIFVVRQQRALATLAVELKAARQLADLRERSDKILDNVSVGVLGATRSGKVVFANRFFTSDRFLLGGGSEDRRAVVAGRSASTKSRAVPKSGRESGRESGGERNRSLGLWTESLRPSIERALALGRTGLISADESLSAKIGSNALDVRVVPLSHPVEEVEALVLVEDLSELHELRRQLVRAEKLITVGVLSAGLAHEVGTPLMVIRGHAEALLEKLRAPAAVAGLQAVIDQIDRITATIRRVLEFSRAQPTEVRPTHLAAALAQAMELLEWRLHTKRISVHTELEPDLPPLAADPLQLGQVLVNLLMNACDASPPNSTVTLAGVCLPGGEVGGAGRAPAHSRVRIDIIDEGAGIRPEHIHAVFDPYFTTKKEGEGTGLGLTIVSQIVHGHRGEIEIQSTLGHGTTVSMTWPSAPAAAGTVGGGAVATQAEVAAHA
jgi:signal transduction histidine kinase